MRIFPLRQPVDCLAMTPHHKLRLANILMLVGIAPVLISMARMVTSFSAATHGRSHIGDALMTIGFAYMFAFVVSCGSAVWSLIVEKRHAGVRVGGSTAIRLLVVLLLVAPLVIGIF